MSKPCTAPKTDLVSQALWATAELLPGRVVSACGRLVRVSCALGRMSNRALRGSSDGQQWMVFPSALFCSVSLCSAISTKRSG